MRARLCKSELKSVHLSPNFDQLPFPPPKNMAPKKTKAAAAPAKAAPKVANPLFPARKKNFRIGGDVRVRCYPGAL